MRSIKGSWRIALAAVAALSLVGLVSVASAQGPGGPGWGPRGGPRGMALGIGPLEGLMLPLRAANLTDAQRTQVRALTEQFRKTWEPQLRPALKAVADAVKANDANAITTACNSLAPIQLNATLAAAQLRAGILALLTPAQQQQIEQFEAQMQQRRQTWEQRHQNHNPGGGR
jgi:Spy/CpxP family protein refolding chaperone